MWGGVEYEIQYQGSDDFYIGEAARSSEVRFKEHIAITTASTTAVVDVQATCTLDINTASILAREEDMFHWSGPRIFCRAPTLHRDTGYEHPTIIETFCQVIHRTNQATKCPTPSFDKESFYSKQFTSSQALKDEVISTGK